MKSRKDADNDAFYGRKDGKITAKKAGKTTITVKVRKKTKKVRDPF